MFDCEGAASAAGNAGEDMELKDYLGVIRKQWASIAATALSGPAGAGRALLESWQYESGILLSEGAKDWAAKSLHFAFSTLTREVSALVWNPDVRYAGCAARLVLVSRQPA